MKTNKLKKALIVLLTCAMFTTTIGQTNTINAEEIQTQLLGDTPQEQTPTDEETPQEPVEEETNKEEVALEETNKEETNKEEPEVEKKRDPQDITKSEDILSLGLKGARYQQAKKEEVLLSSKENQLDLSTMPLDVESLILQFMMTPGSDPLKAEIIKGDTFSIVLAKETFTATQETTPKELKMEEEVIATYTIIDNTIKVEFIKDIDKEAFTKFEALLEIPVKLNQEAITTKTPNVELTLQNDKTITTLVLPKKKEEVKKEEVKKEPAAQPEKPKVEAPKKEEKVATTTVTMEKEWIDNNDVNRPVQGLIDAGAVNVYFMIDGKNNTKLDSENMNKIGLSVMPTIKATPDGTSHTTYSVEGLPITVLVDGEVKPITYALTENRDVAKRLGYYKDQPQIDDKATFNIKAKTFSVNLAVKAGATNPDPTELTNLTLYDNKGNPVKTSAPIYDEETGTYSIPDLPIYTRDGTEIVYYLKADDPTDKTKDWYLPEYDNVKVPNHGTNTTECYDGGTINLTLTGTTSYTGTKTWLDDNAPSTERPDGTLYLWRYTEKEGNGYKQASQVRDESNEVIVLNLDKTQNSYIFTVGDGSTTGKDFALPKYDAEGYPYVYLMREVLGGGSYKQVYGEVTQNKDGTFTTEDTLPVNVKRDGSDASLYNGGTLSNLRTGTTSAKTEKTWRAATYQNQLDKVTVTMTLQKRVKGQTPGDTWKNTETTKKLTGFIAEIMTMKAEETPALYDEIGRELEYQWVETSIKEDGKELLSEDGRFRLACNSKDINEPAVGETDGKIDIENFKSVVEQIDKDDSTQGTRVVNKLEGTLDYTVDKKWLQADGTYGKTAPGEAKIGITIYQNDVKYKEYTMDGTTDETIDGDHKENSPWHLYINDLPKYDEDGRVYTYIAEETTEYTEIGGTVWKATEKHFAKERRTEIKNDPTGPGNLIRVQKNWIDDSDVEHRYPVVVEVYRKDNDKKIGETTLNPENNWWDEIAINDDDVILNGKKELDYSQYTLKEVKLQTKDGKTCNTKKPELCKPTKGEGEDGSIETVTTDEHIYEVTYGIENQMLTVTNRRIGIIDLKVTKTWIDKGQTVGDRPEAKLILKSSEYPDSINSTENTVTVDLGNDKTAVFEIQDDKGGPSKAIQDVVKTTESGAESSYYFYNLPKYDGKGKVIHYSVDEEETTDGSFDKKDYKINIDEKLYEVGPIHTNDKQEIAVTNQRIATKSIKYHKEWLDAYANQNGKRPDIYLTLWQVDSTNKNPFKVNGTGFKNYLWKNKEDSDDTQNNWTANFSGMPKYDENGQEIIYYAQESTSEDPSQFDYQGVEYKNAKGDIAELGGEDNDLIQDETKKITMLEEEGTFINGIKNNVTIEGKKVWASIPKGFPSASLPKIKVHVDQYLNDVKTKDDIASTEDLKQVGTSNEYNFTIAADKAGNELPKYDAKGNLYEYRVREEVLTSTPTGLASWDDAFQPEINGVEIKNVYNPEVGKIIVKKTLVDTPESIKKVMAVTFEVYCDNMLVDNTDTTEDKTDTKEISEKVGEPLTIHYDDYINNAAEVTFTDLPVYRADGVKYQYHVEETTQSGGFETTVAVSTKGTAEASKTYADGSSSSQTELTMDKALTDENATKQIDFKNTYKADYVKLKGNKKWNDYNDSMGLRPASIKLEVYRSAPAQVGEDNSYPLEKVDSSNYSIVWVTDSNPWTYVISKTTGGKLERYAPNGEEWDYSVKEEVVKGYNNDKEQTVTAKTTIDKDHFIGMKDLENKFKEIKVTKQWSDVNDQYKLRPIKVTVKLQVKEGEAGIFKDAKDYFAGKLDDTSTGETKAYAFERELKKSSWTDTFKNLPYYTKSGGTYTPLIYRVVETKAGEDTVWSDELGYVTDGNHNYFPTGNTDGIDTTDQTTLMTEIKNTLNTETTTLTVIKTWNDSNGIYDSRPMNGKNWTVTFKLSRRLATSTDEKDWVPVNETGTTSQVSRTITGTMDENKKTVTFENLPKFEEGTGNAYVYRATEVAPSSYTASYLNDTADTTNVTNTLGSMEVSVSKTWALEDIVKTHPEVTFELQYSIDDWKTFSHSTQVVLNGEIDDTITTKGEKDAWTATWKGLPKSKDGKDMKYRAVEIGTPSGYWKNNGGIIEITADKGISTITNTPTAFSLNKINEENVAINDVELTIYKATDTKFTTPLVTWTKDTSDNITITPDSTNAPTVVTKDGVIYGLPQGDYILKETKTPAVYATAKNIPFTIKEDGTLSSTTAGAISGDVATGITLTMKDRLAYGHVVLTKVAKKVDNTKCPTDVCTVGGVEFDLYKGDAESKEEGIKIATGITTESDGTWTSDKSNLNRIDKDAPVKTLSDGLEVGKYYFKETKASNNTQLDTESKWGFEITQDNDFVNYPAEKAKATADNKVYSGQITLTKTGENNAPLEGVTFDLYQEGNTTAVRTNLTTNEEGKIIVDGLSEKGTYYFQETKAADGYKLDTTISGKVTLDNTKVTDTVTMGNEKTKFYLDKVDANDAEIKINDVELAIYKAADKTFTTPLVTWARDAKGNITVTPTTDAPSVNKTTNEIIGLPAGDYVLRETKLPKAYAKADDISFTVAADGVLSSTPEDAVSQEEDGYVVTMEDRLAYGHIALTKTVTGGTGDVKGVVFNLYKKDGTLVAENITTKDRGKWTSVESTITRKDNSKLLSEGLEVGSYYFKEISTTNNTLLNTSSKDFEITNTDDYTNKGNQSVEIGFVNNAYSGKITLTKKGDGDSVLEGVTFDLYRDGKKVESQTNLSTDKDGEITVTVSEKGTYYFKETGTLDGYKFNDAQSENVVLDDKVNEGEVVVSKETTMTNELTKFKLNKVSSSTPAVDLNGVTFTIYKSDDTEFKTPLVTWTRDEDGDIKVTPTEAAPTVKASEDKIGEIQGLPKGDYVLEETTPPTEYAKSANITFKIVADGTLSKEESEEGTISEDKLTLTMKDRLAHGNVDLIKVAKNADDSPCSDCLVDGVEFELYKGDAKSDKDGVLIAKGIKTDADGKWTSFDTTDVDRVDEGHKGENIDSSLEVGKYYFKEVSTTDNTFLSNEKWGFEIKNTDDVESATENVKANITNRAYVSKVVLTKIGDDGKHLQGVTFDLYKEGTTEPIKQGLTTNDEGKITEENLVKGEYYFKETKTLDNYLMDEDTKIYKFTLGEKNTALEPIEITVENTTFVSYLQLTKKDFTDGSVLPGTEFTLYKKDAASGKFEKTDNKQVTDKDGVVKFTIHEKGTYKLVESKAVDGYVFDENPSFETVEYVIDNTSTFQDKTHTFDAVENTRKTGSVKLNKIDGDDQSKLNDVVFSLYRKDGSNTAYLGDFNTGTAYTTIDLELKETSTWDSEATDEGLLSLAGLPWGNYFFQEKTGLYGYGVLDDQYEFTIGKDGEEVKLAEDLGTIENHKTVFSFDKMGLYVEECSDTTLGSESPEAKLPLENAEFTVYSDLDCKDEIMSAKSAENGKVTFVGLPIGTNYMVETGTPQGHVPNDTIYKVIVKKDGSTSLEDTSKANKALTEIINDVYRSDISIKKVSKTNPNKVLANSLYGLYRRSFTANNATTNDTDLQLVATARTDASGILTFKGVLMNEEYIVQELEAPDGSQVSQNPITLRFHVKDGVVLLDSFDDGKGTAYLDENGQIVWKEPQVTVCFEKKDEKGNLLANATLQVEDKDGNVVIGPWISTKQKGFISEGKLVAGETYRLVEVKAPSGYFKSKDVEFTVEKVKVSPDEDYVQYVEMTDKLKPVIPNESTNTGDSTNFGMYVMLQVVSIGTILGVVATKRKKKQKN